MNSESPAEINPLPAKHRHIPNWLGCVFTALAVVVLIVLFLPIFGHTAQKAPQTKALASAKQIGLALKLYAMDNEGRFPTTVGDPAASAPSASAAANANAAFANLFPTYCNAEKLFYVRGSAYCNPTPPDEIANTKATCLVPGENEYAYIAGLTDKSDPTLPLVVDGTDGTGHYVSDKTRRGGVWGGKKAIVIHVDTSGEVANLTGPDSKRFVPRSHDDRTHNLLAPAYLNTFDARLLDPAVKAEGKR